jgi:6-phosphogluconate dehydrogenase
MSRRIVMKIALVGLGRMGMNMARRLLNGGHQVVAYNRTRLKTDEAVKEGVEPAYSLKDLGKKLPSPRIVWLMLPAGSVIDEHLDQLKGILSEGDVVVEGGNSYYKDSVRRFQEMAERGIEFLDAGVSGGIWGLKEGYCLMVGGRREIFSVLEPVFKTLAPEGGYMYCGPAGSGHFVKMVHNGIEYGMMQAYGEGFQLLEASPYGQSLDYAELARLWNRGSVIRSWLLELAESAFRSDPKLSGLSGFVEDSGEGRWAVKQAVETAVSAPVITLSLMSRFKSRDGNSFSDRLIAALRREFGGHRVIP